jgi:hypothetical protein
MERDGGGRGMRYVPSWTALEEAAREELKRSGLTSSDDAPRYRRGSKRPPRPPKTPPGLLRPPHDAVQRARFAGRGRGWAAIREIPAATVLFQERPLVIAGAFDADEDALREMTRVLVTDPSHASTWLRRVDGVSLSTSTDSPTRRAHSSASESSPIDGVDDASWNDARAFVRRRAAVRRSRVDANDEAAETAAAPAGRSASDASTDDDAGGDEGDGSSSSSSEDRRAGGKGKGGRARFVVTLFANASAINHACAPNAGAFYVTLVPIRPRRRGGRRSLRNFPGVSLRPGSLAFNPRPRRLSTPTDAFELHPDVRFVRNDPQPSPSRARTSRPCTPSARSSPGRRSRCRTRRRRCIFR